MEVRKGKLTGGKLHTHMKRAHVCVKIGRQKYDHENTARCRNIKCFTFRPPFFLPDTDYAFYNKMLPSSLISLPRIVHGPFNSASNQFSNPLFKSDFKNVFNTISRDAFLKSRNSQNCHVGRDGVRVKFAGNY